MNSKVDKSVIQKVKDILQIEEDLNSIELLKILKDHRNRNHPDKFSGEKARENAEEKFKELGSLYDELNAYIESERLYKSAKELASFEPLYENVSLQSKLDEANDKIKDLENQIEALNKNNKQLNDSLNLNQNKELEEENLKLKELYKPSTQKLASLGIMFLLTSTIAVMTKIEEVSAFIKKYSPFPESYLNIVIFSIFVFMLLIVIKQFVENKLISLRVSEVCSPKFSKDFWSYLSANKEWEDGKTKDFAEEDVFYFIHGKESKMKKAFATLGFRLFQIETSDRLKNFVINTLLNKKLIEISLANSLTRTFSIKEGRRKYYYYDRD